MPKRRLSFGVARANTPKQMTGTVLSSPAMAEDSPVSRWTVSSTGDSAATAIRRFNADTSRMTASQTPAAGRAAGPAICSLT